MGEGNLTYKGDSVQINEGLVVGIEGAARLRASMVQSAGHLIEDGDVQFMRAILRDSKTAGNTGAWLTLDKGNEYLLIPKDRAWFYRGVLMAIDEDCNAAIWDIQGFIVNDDGSVSSPAGSMVETEVENNLTDGWSPTITTSNAAGGKLDIKMNTGSSAKATRFVCSIEITQVGTCP